MSTFTTNLNLELVARGDFVGTWDTPENSNWSLVDAAMGGITSVPLVGTNVTLSQSQYKNNFINFTGTLTHDVAIVFPPIARLYTIQNLISNSTQYNISLTLGATTATGWIGIPPKTPHDVMSDGVGMKHRNLPPIGTYWDVGDLNLTWLLGESGPTYPWLACDGTAFSSALYPVLTNILGGTTLPDSRGRFRATYNSGTQRIFPGLSGGLDGNTLLAGGGQYFSFVGLANLPPYTPSGTVSTPTGTVSTPTGTVSTPTGTVSTPTGSVSTPTGSVTVSTPTGTVSVSTPTGTVTMNSLAIESFSAGVTAGGTAYVGGGGARATVSASANITFTGGAASGSFTGDPASGTFTGNAATFTGNAATFTGNPATFTGNPATFTGNAATFTGTAQGGSGTEFNNVPPGYIGGITFIRAG